MNWYKLIFFHIYKRYYKDGQYSNDIPWLTVSVILGVSSFFYLLSLAVLIYSIFCDCEIQSLNKNPIIILGFVLVGVNYLWFFNNRHYLKIYEKYRISENNNKFSELLSWLFVIMGFVSVPLVALIIKSL